MMHFFLRTTWSLAALAVLAAVVPETVAAEKTARQADATPDAAALARVIDREIDQVLAADKLAPAPRADDAEFLRRAYLDITGVIPPADRAREFLDSKDPAKRAKLIDELLASAHYGRHMADLWQAMMLPRNSDNRRLQNEPFVKWLEAKFNDNTPWNRLVTEILTASGPQDQNPAVTFFLANPTADKMTDQVSRLFLGVQLQCAQCHNHPFTTYKQNDYWGMAAFFLKVRSDRVNAAAKNGASPGIVEDPKLRQQRGLPESAKVLPPKFLQAAEAKTGANDLLRPVFAEWLTSPDNKFFARALVNRLWHQMFGRGLVNPVDDMHDGQTPSHPELLKELSAAFIASGYDVKFLVRAIGTSQAYQRTARASGGSDEVAAKFGRMAVKVLTPEQLFDSLEMVLGKQGPGRPEVRGQRNQPNNARAAFVAFFSVGDEADPTEYQAGIPQVLRLMNSGQMNGNSTLLAEVLKIKDPSEALERIYLATLGRRPTAAEAAKLAEFVKKSGDARTAYGDVIWAVLNSSEFALCH
jgi:hypothetical protein